MISPESCRRFGRVGMPPQAVSRVDYEGRLLPDPPGATPSHAAGDNPHHPATLHDPNHPRIKCVLVGDGAIGKTSLVVSYTTNGYPTEYVPTAFDNYAVLVTVDNRPIRLQLCDTAGQDDFDSLRPLCYPGTDVFLMCFSVVSPTSFHNLREKWVPEIRTHCNKAPIVLIGTQCDLRNDVKVLIELAHYDERPITEAEAKTLARQIGAEYIECSALTQKNLKEVFDSAILAAVKHQGILDENSNSSPDTPVKRGKKSKKKAKQKKYSPKEQRTPPSGKRLIPAESREFIKPSKGWKKFCCMV